MNMSPRCTLVLVHVYRARTGFLTDPGGLKLHARARLSVISLATADVDVMNMKLLVVNPLPAFGSKNLRSPELVWSSSCGRPHAR